MVPVQKEVSRGCKEGQTSVVREDSGSYRKQARSGNQISLVKTTRIENKLKANTEGLKVHEATLGCRRGLGKGKEKG